MREIFIMGTEDGGVSFDIFEIIDCDPHLVCTTRDIKCATFITAALNHCKDFWQLSQEGALLQC
jgi:hypothetical protein